MTSASVGSAPRLGRATVVTATASALAQAVQLAALVQAARWLGPDAFGGLGFATATAATASSVAAFAPALHTARAFSIGQTDGLPRAYRESAAFCAVAVLLLLAVRLTGAMPLLASWTNFGAMAVLLVATGQQLIASHALIGVQRFQSLGLMRVIGALTGAAGLIIGAWRGDVALAALGLTLGQVASVAVAWRGLAGTLTGSRARNDAPPNASARAQLPPQRVAALVAALLGGPVFWLAQAIVAGRREGAAEMARIAAVAPVAMAVLFIPSQLGHAWFAALARDADVRGTLRRALRVTALAGGGVGVLFAATSPWWGAVFGPGFNAIAPVAVPLLVAAAIQGTVAPAVRVLEARGHVGETAWLNVLLAAVTLGGTWLTPSLGAVGYAHSVAAAFAVHGGLLAWRVRRRLVDMTDAGGR